MCSAGVFGDNGNKAAAADGKHIDGDTAGLLFDQSACKMVMIDDVGSLPGTAMQHWRTRSSLREAIRRKAFRAGPARVPTLSKSLERRKWPRAGKSWQIHRRIWKP